MSVLAIDPATMTGWCYTEADLWPDEPRSVTIKRMKTSILMGLWDGRPYKKQRPELLNSFFSCIEELIKESHPSQVVYEMPFVSNHTSARLQYGLCCLIELACAKARVPVFTLHPSKIKMIALGVGRASKADILKSAQFFLPEINDHNIADAFWLAVAFIGGRR